MSHALRSSSTEEPVIRPSTRRVTALLDDSTTVTLSIAVHLISLDLIKQLTYPSQNHAGSEISPRTHRGRLSQYLTRINKLRRFPARSVQTAVRSRAGSERRNYHMR